MRSANYTEGVMPPPPGVTPNFINPESNAWQLVLPSVLLTVIAIAVYLLRLYTSYFIVKRCYPDDGKCSS